MSDAKLYPTYFEWVRSFNSGDDLNNERLEQTKKELRSILGIEEDR